MGIKENFSQAVRELTGGGKDEKRTDTKSTVDGMRNAVAAEDTSEFMAVTENTQPDNSSAMDEFEEIERRAALAAEDLNRRQDEFTQSAPPQPEPVPESIPIQQPSYTQQSVPPQQNSFGNYYGQQQTPPPQPPVPPQPPYRAPEPNPFARQVDENETTIISRNTVIDGNIRSFANMSIDGNVKGNVETTKDIDLNGKIVGNIACNNASLRTSQIQGNIQMKGNAFMERDTLLIGDLTSTYANVNGKIKGNLSITGKAELKSDAVVFGDISASTITVNDGAIIQGYVSTTFLNKEESKNIFPDTITIGE